MPLLLHSHISPRALPLPFLNHSDAALTGWRSLRKSFLSGQAAGRSELPVYRSRQSVSSPVNTQPHSAGNRQHIRNLLWPSPAGRSLLYGTASGCITYRQESLSSHRDVSAAAMSISACSLPVPPRGQSFDAFRASEAGEIPKDRIVYTHTDEAPMLATYSLLPILQRFAEPLGIKLVTRDISLAGRILAAFSDKLPEAQVSTHLLRTRSSSTRSIVTIPICHLSSLYTCRRLPYACQACRMSCV